MVGFSGILGIGQVEDQKMIKEKLIDGKKLLVDLEKNAKNANSKFDDYSISPKIRQILLHWGYELIKKDFELSN